MRTEQEAKAERQRILRELLRDLAHARSSRAPWYVEGLEFAYGFNRRRLVVKQQPVPVPYDEFPGGF